MKRNEVKLSQKYRICSRKTEFLINDIVEVDAIYAKGGFRVSCGKQSAIVKSSDLAEY